MNRFDESFKSVLVGVSFDTIESSLQSIFALSPNLKLIYFNKAWFEFAKNNNGEPGISTRFHLGTSFEDGLSGLLKEFYIKRYKAIIKDQKVWKHEYECSSATNYRLFCQDAYPLKNKAGIIIVNSLKIDRIIEEDFRKTSTFSATDYLHVNGLISQCSNCRRTKRNVDLEIWDWVPELVENFHENVSHTICPVCFDYYWSGED